MTRTEPFVKARPDDVEVTFHDGDAEELDLPPASVDAITGRAAIMYFVDVVGTLARLRGSTEVEAGTQTAVWPFPSRQAATRFLQDVAPPVTALFAGQPDEVARHVWQQVTEQAWERFVEPDGQVRLPNEASWVAAVNPS